MRFALYFFAQKTQSTNFDTTNTGSWREKWRSENPPSLENFILSTFSFYLPTFTAILSDSYRHNFFTPKQLHFHSEYFIYYKTFIFYHLYTHYQNLLLTGDGNENRILVKNQRKHILALSNLKRKWAREKCNDTELLRTDFDKVNGYLFVIAYRSQTKFRVVLRIYIIYVQLPNIIRLIFRLDFEP